MTARAWQRERLRTLVTGELILVRYGSDGHQLAQVERPVTGNPSKVWVRKFRANSRRWTNPVQIAATDIVDATAPAAKRAKDRIWPRAKAAGTPLPVNWSQRGIFDR